MSPPKTVFDLRDVSKHFPVRSGTLRQVTGWLRAVDRVDLRIPENTIMGLVGESGSGKTTLGRLMVKLLKTTSGEILYEDKNLEQLSRRELRWFRKNVQMLFQDPYLSLNPRRRVFDALAYPLKAHGLASKDERGDKVRDLLHQVGLEASFAEAYPHELSGGERQRVSLAAALSVEPRFIFCDEPVSDLDASARAQVLNLLSEVQRERKLTMLIVSHDLSAVEYVCDDVAVMYLGSFVEFAKTGKIFGNAGHPYTDALIGAIPEPDPDFESKRREVILEGEIPSPVNPPQGCKFHTRCPKKIGTVCETAPPAITSIEDDHWVACHLFPHSEHALHSNPPHDVERTEGVPSPT